MDIANQQNKKQLTKRYLEISNEGRAGFTTNLSLTENPYDKQSLDFLAWAYGFIDARAETLGH